MDNESKADKLDKLIEAADYYGVVEKLSNGGQTALLALLSTPLIKVYLDKFVALPENNALVNALTNSLEFLSDRVKAEPSGAVVLLSIAVLKFISENLKKDIEELVIDIQAIYNSLNYSEKVKQQNDNRYELRKFLNYELSPRSMKKLKRQQFNMRHQINKEELCVTTCTMYHAYHK